MYMQNNIIVFLDTGGFANRINAILSGLYVANLINYNFIICWPQNTWCQASFHDIFSNTNFTIINDLNTINQLLKNQDNAIVFENNTTKEELFQQIDKNKEQHIYFKNCLIPSWISKHECAKLFDEILHVNESITSVVNEFISTKLVEPYYGIHIRNTDISIGLNYNEVMHITQMYKTRKFFLCSDSSASEDIYSKIDNIIVRKKEEYPEKIIHTQDFSVGVVHEADTEDQKITLNINRSKNATIDGVIDFLILVNSTIIGYSGSTYQQLAKDLQHVINYTNTDRLENIDFIESATIQKLFEQSDAIDLQTFVKVIQNYEIQSKIDILSKSLQYFKGGDLLVVQYNLAVEFIPINKEQSIHLLQYAIALYPAFTQAIDLLNRLINENNNPDLKIIHNCGFFSCCSVRLYKIIEYMNYKHTLPKRIDCSELFTLYKYNSKIDITYDFFENYDNEIKIEYENHFTIDVFCFQFENYKKVNYEYIKPFVDKFFLPSQKIINIYNNLLLKYRVDIENCVGLYYRGTDKVTETQIDSFDSYYNKLNEIDNINNMQIIVQTDSAQFLNYMKQKCTDKNIIIINENITSNSNHGIHNEKTACENYIDIQFLFATFLIISKCKYIICSSGNCSIWMMFYRNNAINVYQNLNKKWL